jgi:hypothetical protein
MPFVIKKTLPDGTEETFRPHRYADGSYRVEIRVSDPDEVRRLAADGCAVRMKGDVQGKLNLIKQR